MPVEYVKPGQFPRKRWWKHPNRKRRDHMHSVFVCTVCVILGLGLLTYAAVMDVL